MIYYTPKQYKKNKQFIFNSDVKDNIIFNRYKVGQNSFINLKKKIIIHWENVGKKKKIKLL